jgi:hypothetical protein
LTPIEVPARYIGIQAEIVSPDRTFELLVGDKNFGLLVVLWGSLVSAHMTLSKEIFVFSTAAVLESRFYEDGKQILRG